MRLDVDQILRGEVATARILPPAVLDGGLEQRAQDGDAALELGQAVQVLGEVVADLGRAVPGIDELVEGGDAELVAGGFLGARGLEAGADDHCLIA